MCDKKENREKLTRVIKEKLGKDYIITEPKEKLHRIKIFNAMVEKSWSNTKSEFKSDKDKVVFPNLTATHSFSYNHPHPIALESAIGIRSIEILGFLIVSYNFWR